jgi:hypothetical protein
MSDETITLWDWLVREWSTPRWRKTVRLLAAAVLGAAGVIFITVEPAGGNWILCFTAAVIFLILGLRIEVPEEPLPVDLEGFGPAEQAQPSPAALPGAEGVVETPPTLGGPGEIETSAGKRVGILAILRLPLAAMAAFSAQWVMDFRPTTINEARNLGTFLYAVAFLLLGWALLSGDAVFPLESTSGKGRGIKPNLLRISFFVFALFFGVLAYVGSSGGMFRPLALITLAIALGYWWIALSDYSGGLGEGLIHIWKSVRARIQSVGTRLLDGITLSSWSLLVVVCFAALVFTRTYNMVSVPPEMTSDHVEKLINVNEILQGKTYIFFANNGGREPLEFYLVALISQLFGTGISFLSLKIVSVAVGILTLPFLYLLGREVADRRVGLLAMILGGVAYWPDMISRIGLRLPLAMLFCAITLYFFFKAIRRRRWNDFLWAGIALGVGMYGYTPIRIVPVALAVITGLFILHPSSKGSRAWAAAGFLATLGTMVLLFIPFLRYAVEFPKDFWLRTVTRIVPGEGPVTDPVWTFLKNLWNAMQMFSWNDGVGWFNCVPLRPALDVITGGLFHLGLIGVVVHALKKRTWEALSLALLIPILLLPSILALAMPNENPSLARAIAAVPAVFLMPALALVLLADFLRGLVPGRSGLWIGVGLASILVAVGAAQDFDLTLRQYPATYRVNSENASELGLFMKEFVSSIGRPEDAYFIPYPYWVDDRIVNIAAGFPIDSAHYVFPGDIPAFEFSGRPTLFLLLATDVESLEALKQKFPNGYYASVSSSYPNHDFIYFIVPGTPVMENP